MFSNTIEYELYNVSLVKLLLFFIGSFEFYDIFRDLVSKHDELESVVEKYNYFETDDDVKSYLRYDDNIFEVFKTCFENDLQNLAMYYL